MTERARHIIVIGGGTAGSVLAARLSESPALEVTLLEAGGDHGTYDEGVLDPALASAAWTGATTPAAVTPMRMETGGAILMLQGRLLGGTSALNGLATVRGMPADYDGWAAAGLEGWGWK
ncbi:MAG TPA: GMC family oxidoreductase N-terminal domain-containing protein, partial [Myxococcota bacterium]|nr:GMC family oxidoreductase N-terminal domain-containing protein [Myxococcota bacterium]